MTTEVVAVADVLAELGARPRGERMHEVLVLGGRARLRMTATSYGRMVVVAVDVWSRQCGGWLLRWSRTARVDESQAGAVLRQLVDEEIEEVQSWTA